LISGKILLKTPGTKLHLAVNCLGRNADGKLESPGVGFELGDTASSATCSTWSPRDSTLAWDPKTGATHRHVNRIAGHYLVYLTGRITPDDPSGKVLIYDWQWVELKDDRSKLTVDLTVDPDVLGRVEVTVRNAPQDAPFSFVPLDAKGGLPLPDALGYLSDLHVKLQGVKGVFQRLREGKYRFTLGQAKADVDVKRGATTTVEMSWPAAAVKPPLASR